MPEVVTFSPSSPGANDEALGAQLVEQFGMDQMHLAQVGLGRILADARAMLDRLAHMGVAGDTQARSSRMLRLGVLLK